MSQQDAAKEQANTRKNVRIVSVFTAAAIGIVGVLVILYAWQLPPFTRHAQFTDNAYVRGQTTFISPQVNGYITEVKVQDFEQVKKGDLLLQIDSTNGVSFGDSGVANFFISPSDLERLDFSRVLYTWDCY